VAKCPGRSKREWLRPMAAPATTSAGTATKSTGHPMAAPTDDTKSLTAEGNTLNGKLSTLGISSRRNDSQSSPASGSEPSSGGDRSGSEATSALSQLRVRVGL